MKRSLEKAGDELVEPNNFFLLYFAKDNQVMRVTTTFLAFYNK
jgi:hypothetical protein